MRSALAAVLALCLAPAAFAATARRIDRPAPSRLKPATVTLDVKDENVREVMKSLQRQCGIKNIAIDPDVEGGRATFLFHDLPCSTAFDIVLRTYKLRAQTYSSSVVSVGTRH